jgi:sialic acid synthase SpsE
MSRSFFIAEISNCHGGDMDRAKDLIRLAREAGAGAVKGQAFVPSDMIGLGSMPDGFYEQCAFSLEQYEELIDYGRDIGIPMFYTVLGDRWHHLNQDAPYIKIHAARFKEMEPSYAVIYDSPRFLISIAEPRPEVKLKHAHVMYATGYLEQIDLVTYKQIRNQYDRAIGVSHHGIKTQDLKGLAATARLPIIEKHFCDGKPVTYDGQVYRDTIHGATPGDFERLVRAINS